MREEFKRGGGSPLSRVKRLVERRLKSSSDSFVDTETIEADTVSPEDLVVPAAKGVRLLFSSLSSPDFRYFFFGAAFSNIGTWVQTVALGWLVYEITKSSFYLGFVSFIGNLPVFLLALFAGGVADRLNRKMIVLWTQAILMVFAFILAIFTSLNSATVLNISIISFGAGMAMAFSFPAWQAMISDIVPRKDLLNAIALNSAQFNTARLLGPFLAGLILSGFGVAACFYINGISYLAVIAGLLLIKEKFVPVKDSGQKIWAHAIGGIGYARQHRAVANLFLTMTVLVVLGMPFAMLMPIFAVDILKVGARGNAFLLAANGFGALLGSLNVAYLASGSRKNELIAPSLLIFGLSVAVFSLSKSYPLSLLAMLVSGGAFSTVASSINNALQSSVPNEVRGRVMAIFVWIFLGLTPIGSLVFGLVAEFLGAPTAVFIGALSCVVAAGLIMVRPELITADLQ